MPLKRQNGAKGRKGAWGAEKTYNLRSENVILITLNPLLLKDIAFVGSFVFFKKYSHMLREAIVVFVCVFVIVIVNE